MAKTEKRKYLAFIFHPFYHRPLRTWRDHSINFLFRISWTCVWTGLKWSGLQVTLPAMVVSAYHQPKFLLDDPFNGFWFVYLPQTLYTKERSCFSIYVILFQLFKYTIYKTARTLSAFGVWKNISRYLPKGFFLRPQHYIEWFRLFGLVAKI